MISPFVLTGRVIDLRATLDTDVGFGQLTAIMTETVSDEELTAVESYCKGQLDDDTFEQLVDEDICDHWTTMAEALSASELERAFSSYQQLQYIRRMDSISIDGDGMDDGDPSPFR